MKISKIEVDNIKRFQQLIKEEISFPEYLKKRGLSKYDNLKELKYIVNNNQYLLDGFLSIISIGLRCRVMKGLFDLIDDEIELFIDFSSSQISDFIRKNLEYNRESQVISQRTTSQEMIYDLAIVLDLPSRYLENTSAEYEMINSFTEYKTSKIKKMNLNGLIGEILFEMNQTSRLKRRIFGVKIKNNFFDAGNSRHLFARVDIRENFFTIEMHLVNKANINYPELKKLEESVGMKSEIFIRDAFLRTNQKLCILISIEDNKDQNIVYLNKDLLWRNVLFEMKDEELTKLMEEKEINIIF
ncbi:hypothetical protein PB01_17000 [Psychrobacillus glaciei]|uniref:Uncharacterized protein n=1 Tax=Psychrobacillus glaciei TaxID=2283160 RepID=A0A5J6SQX0_9BACI|nr:hypothetical protein [Psychrobacillus glaciei]QFG00366.1 hypothetical protein PB01_17000 [Psychrobacillus glaciei]